MTLTLAERVAREARIKEMIGEGYTIAQMADEFDITAQAIHSFLKVRGWKTARAEQ